MSKSTGEFLTVSLLEEKGYSPLVYRLFCLQSHYRKSLVFSWEGLDGTKTAYSKLISKIAALKPNSGEIDSAAFDALKKKFTDAMDNDLNTSLAITAVYDVLKAQTNDETKLALIADFDKVLSLSLLEEAAIVRASAEEAARAKAAAAAANEFHVICASDNVDAETKAKVEALIRERADAKKSKNFARADEIRAVLSDMGVTLTDAKDGVTWTK